MAAALWHGRPVPRTLCGGAQGAGRGPDRDYHRASVLESDRLPGAPPQTQEASSGQRRDEPLSVLLFTPRWARDGGVGAHVEASAAALAQAGHEVTIVAARIESSTRIPGVTLTRNPKLCRAE